MAQKMVHLRGVGVRYSPGRYALRDVSFDLSRGEFAYITGANGAGKTTLLKILFAMERASEGNIYVNSRNVALLPKKEVYQYRREVGFVFQDFKLLPDLTIYDNVALPLEVRKMTPGEVDHRVRGVLSLVGLGDRAHDYPQTLSGGEQQRVSIARSIIGRPSLLLADEPTGNLDANTARDIMSLFLEINDMGTTVLIATHDEGLMTEFPARTIRLQSGRLIHDRGHA